MLKVIHDPVARYWCLKSCFMKICPRNLPLRPRRAARLGLVISRPMKSIADKAVRGPARPASWAQSPHIFPVVLLLLFLSLPLRAQTLLNVDFGVGSRSLKTGVAATGQSTNDFWNLYRHYDPKFLPGTTLVPDGLLKDLKLADGTETKVSVAANNAPGVWGNSTGDAMYDTYIFANNGSNITVTVENLEAGRYHFYLYGHADSDVTGEQNSAFTIHSGTNSFGPLITLGSTGWKTGSPWQERYQYVVFRDVPVLTGKPVIIEVAPGANGVAVLNGLQISSRGTSPPKLLIPTLARIPSSLTNLIFHQIHYAGKVTDSEARFSVDLSVESLTTNQISAPLFDGDVAVLLPELPEGLRVASSTKQYRLIATAPGTYNFKLELVARITKAEPWNQISFIGPSAAIASVTVQASTPGVEMQLLSGTQIDSPKAGGTSAPLPLVGFLGIDRTLSMRWQGKTTEITRKSLVTVDTLASAQITPTVIKYTTQLRYEILQASIPKMTVALPSSHALTKLQGEQIRDWNVKAEGDHQLLTIEFIKPIEKSYTLMLFSEQTLDVTVLATSLMPPRPLEVERESGSITISADDMLVDIESATGLRQVNASAGALAAYRFYGRPFALAARLKRIEPILKVADRVTARLEETRLLVSHALVLTVEKAGIYALDLSPQPGFSVSEVRGDGIDDWKLTDGKLRVSFSSRVLDSRKIDVQLEQALKTFPDQIAVAPLRVTLATNETAQIGAASALGIRLKTAGELTGLREIPVSSLPARSDELLAFSADQPDWKLTLAAERLPARVVAEVFNLVTIGDGLVGGSATIRYGLINQGVQEFKLRLPAHWKNVEFTGPNIRRKEQVLAAPAAPQAPETNFTVWTIALQDKAWGGYTLVITYDYQFDAKRASLNLDGAHALGVERETGSVAITTAASLKLEPKAVADPLRVIDPTELTETDRALITRPVLLAYRYTGDSYQLAVNVVRHQEVDVLDAVADRTQITSVLTEAGQMLTQASFMVKNNDRQFQKFRLPSGAKLWGCNVNNQPVKAELDGEWLAVSLPRGANRDEAFAVDIVYEQTVNLIKSSAFPRSLQLAAPRTDVPNTYAEWQIYVPPTQRLSGFGGNMTVLRGTTYGLRDAWLEFKDFYDNLFHESGGTILAFGCLAILLVAIVGGAIRQGWSGVVVVLGVFFILAILAAMMFPALAKAKAKASRISAVSHLKQIGLAARMFANDNGGRFPVSFDEMKNELGNPKVIIDPDSGLPFIYAGAGKNETNPQAIVAYSPVEKGGVRTVCFADGSAAQMTTMQFAQALQLDAAASGQANVLAQQADVIRQQQARTLPNVPPGPTAPAPMNAPLLTNPNGVNPATGLPMAGNQALLGAGQGGGGGLGVPTPLAGAMIPPTAAGIRSLRLDIPRTGQPFTFTKVLNVSDEALSVKMSMMKYKWFRFWRALLQLTAFLAGLLMMWRQWRRAPRGSFWMAVGLALAIGSVSGLLIAGRVLHLAFIVAAPALLLAVLFWLTWKYWPRKGAVDQPPRVPSASSPLGPEPTGPSNIPPAVALIALLFFLSQTNGMLAQNAPDADQSSNPTNAFSIISGNYTGRVREKVAQFDVTLLVSTFATNQTVPLFGEDVALQEFSTKANDAKLLRQGNKVALRLGEKGNATVQLKIVVKLSGDVSKSKLVFAIPPALSSKLMLTIAETEADVEFPTAVSFQRTPDKQETRVEAILGSGDRVELFWTPRVKRVTDMAASIFVQNTTLVSFGGGAVNTRATLDYQVTQGELRQAKVRLPAGQRLLRVEGELIRTWELHEEGQQQMLTVDLVKGVSPSYRLTVETEALLDKLPAQVKIEVPSAQEVIRETGLIGMRGSEELSLSTVSAQELQRVDAADFAKTSPVKAEGVTSAYRFLKANFELLARVEAVQSQVEAVVRNAIRIGFEEVNISATVEYTIKKAGVFSLKLALPAGYKVKSVSGQKILQWAEKTEPRTLEVALKERAMGAFTLGVELVKGHKELPKTLEIVGVSPLEIQKLTGFVSVSSEPGVSMKTALFDGLMEIPAASLLEIPKSSAGSSSVLAYKFIATEPPAASTWRLTVATEAVDSWVRAEIINIISVTETLVSGRTLARFDIMNAPVKEFRLQVPATYKNVEIGGTNIRRRDQTNNEWRVELQNKVRGAYMLTITWEQPPNAKTNVVEVSGIAALGVERETGSVVMMTRPPLQVIEKSATEQLVKIDARELPDWAGVSTGASAAGAEMPVLVYRYLRPGYTLALEARRFEEAAVLQALVDSAHLTTVLADDGQMMTEMTLAIRNNGLQHLGIELPPNTKVWSAFVAGQPVRPSQQDGKLMLPLERSGADEAPVSLELTFVGLDKFPRTKGTVNLVSPKLSVPLKNARWDLYLPPDFNYTKFEGSMAHEAETAPTIQVYSSREYEGQEQQKRIARKSEAQNFLSNARSLLASGSVKGANGDYQRLNAYADDETRKELESLKKDLGKAQSGNLIKAQRSYTFEYNSKYGAQPQGAASSGAGGFGGANAPPAQQAAQAAEMVQYDAEVAERQWDVLQKAQEISVAKVQPLRANLPTRGQRHSFSQVLQTELNKPMTIQFHAANTKETGLATRVIYVVGGFLMLWIFVAAVAKRPGKELQAQAAVQ